MEPLIQDKSIDISISIPTTYLWFDENKMSRIFYNLISNAVKYTDEGGEIEIKASVHQKNVIIDFIDNGFGIPDVIKDKIFQPFFTTKEKGDGLALSSSQKVLRDMGGEIHLNSQYGKGATFTVTVPRNWLKQKKICAICEFDKANIHM